MSRDFDMFMSKHLAGQWLLNSYYKSILTKESRQEGGILRKETIESHREIADAIACRDPLRAQDAMYLHLVYNRKWICSLSQKQ